MEKQPKTTATLYTLVEYVDIRQFRAGARESFLLWGRKEPSHSLEDWDKLHQQFLTRLV
jgi:hypothetical protein